MHIEFIGESYRMSMEWEREVGISPFSANKMGNLLSFFLGNTYDHGHGYFFLIGYF
jgi:hypothetical protein